MANRISYLKFLHVNKNAYMSDIAMIDTGRGMSNNQDDIDS